MAPSTRDDLVRAGLDLNDELTLDRLYASVTTAAVAARAGVTTGSFFHHFRNGTEFAVAMLRSYDRERPTTAQVGQQLITSLPGADMTDAIATVLAGAWQLVSADPAMRAERRGQMHLFAHRLTTLPADVAGPTVGDDTAPRGSATGADGTAETNVGDVLRDVYRSQIDDMTEIWKELLDLAEMRLDQPFDVRRLAVAVHSLLLGMEIVHQLDPDAVDDLLFAETTATLATAVTRVDFRPPRVVVAAELGADPEASPQARSGARRRQESRVRVVDAASGLFDHGWDSVSATEVAEAARVSTQTVINLFGNVRRVCAATFARHLAGFEAAIDHAGPERPTEAVRGALLMLARAAATDPHAARALLAERVGVRTARGFDLDDDDIRVLVPLGIRLTPPLAGITGWDLTSLALPDLSSTLIDFVLGHATPRPRRSHETVELAMRLLPAPGAPAPIITEQGLTLDIASSTDSERWTAPRYSDGPSDSDETPG